MVPGCCSGRPYVQSLRLIQALWAKIRAYHRESGASERPLGKTEFCRTKRASVTSLLSSFSNRMMIVRKKPALPKGQTLQAITGWMSPKMIEKYSHVRATAMRKAVSVFDNVAGGVQ